MKTKGEKRQAVLAAALELVATQIGPYDETNDPHYGAVLELGVEVLDHAVKEYAKELE